MTRRAASLVSTDTSERPLATRETVAIDTPASSATCRMVTRPGRGSESLSSTLGIGACRVNRLRQVGWVEVGGRRRGVAGSEEGGGDGAAHGSRLVGDFAMFLGAPRT